MIRAGELNRLVTIQQATWTEDAAGNKVPSDWVTYVQLMARKRDVTGRERLEAQERVAQHSTVFRVYFTDGITTEMRLQYFDDQGKVWNYSIVGTVEMGRREALDLLCEVAKS